MCRNINLGGRNSIVRTAPKKKQKLVVVVMMHDMNDIASEFNHQDVNNNAEYGRE
jgi:AICAR transformylase/IMP cyclohydrolase PurH